MRTYSAKPADVTRKWYVVDVSEAPLGRIATKVATLLTGKGKPQFTKHIDCGDYVIVVNAGKLITSGDKLNQKKYYHYSGFPSGLRTTTLAEKIDNDPTQVVFHAIRGMLPVNKLRDDRLNRLKIYAGEDHNHAAQKPEKTSIMEGK